ncbi:Rhomboid-related protein 4 [Balamuthia mandrillaris]
MYRQRRGGRSSSEMGLFLLLMQVARIGVDNIPPCTLFFAAANVFVHYFVHQVSLGEVCIGSAAVWAEGLFGAGSAWQRLWLASFFHVDDMHLYYNMSSFLWKGVLLEPLFGTPHFAMMIVLFVIISNVMMVGGSFLLMEFFGIAGPFYSCAVGFSAVLFALKVVATYHSPSPTSTYVFCCIVICMLVLCSPILSFSLFLSLSFSLLLSLTQ